MARAQYDPTRAAGSCLRCSQTVDKTKRGHGAPKNIPVSCYGMYSRHEAFALSRQYVAGAICTCIAGEGTTRGEGKGINLVVNNWFEVYVCLGSISSTVPGENSRSQIVSRGLRALSMSTILLCRKHYVPHDADSLPLLWRWAGGGQTK